MAKSRYNVNQNGDGKGLQSTRDAILQRLREHAMRAGSLGAGWCSGEAMALDLGISRAAVSKQVHGLRFEGHVIEASPRRGYRLVHQALPFDLATVSQGLGTRVWGRGGHNAPDFVWLEETPSTNIEAARLAMSGALPGTVVVALHQGAGHGRKGHGWFTAPYSLAFSVVLPSSLQVADLARFTLAVTEATSRAIEAVTGATTQVKPPNDVLLHGLKVAGVLMEVGLRGVELDWAVLGIGVNVNAAARDFPVNLAGKATSLAVQQGHTLCRTTLLQGLLVELEKVFEG